MKYVLTVHFETGTKNVHHFYSYVELLKYLRWSLKEDLRKHKKYAHLWYYTIETIIETK